MNPEQPRNFLDGVAAMDFDVAVVGMALSHHQKSRFTVSAAQILSCYPSGVTLDPATSAPTEPPKLSAEGSSPSRVAIVSVDDSDNPPRMVPRHSFLLRGEGDFPPPR